jgi:hypothetical protein
VPETDETFAVVSPRRSSVGGKSQLMGFAMLGFQKNLLKVTLKLYRAVALEGRDCRFRGYERETGVNWVSSSIG